MEEKNELNDIILNKGGSNAGNKKVLLAIATLAIVLIIVVVIMNRISADSNEHLPQAVLPPEPTDIPALVEDDPLFEPVPIIEEEPAKNDNLDKIAQKLKKESLAEEEVVVIEPVAKPQPVVKPTPKPVAKPAVKPKAVAEGKYYIQVGSFSKYAPNKKFIKLITDNGYSYTYHKVVRSGKTINKVLVGPFENEAAARKAIPVIRKKIESGAFLTKV
ncbi:MAG: SPOR domain-containing protein [Campylobacterota bacterium]|nr:SPOR domain-containing protein [Campylobacterota bacterium]